MERASALSQMKGDDLPCCYCFVNEKALYSWRNIATKILKDGDLVEVDANTGVVKRLCISYFGEMNEPVLALLSDAIL